MVLDKGLSDHVFFLGYRRITKVVRKASMSTIVLKKEGKLTKIGINLQKIAKNNFPIEILAENIYNIYLRMNKN